MIIPYEKLSIEALEGVIVEFVSREGTDTGYTGMDMSDIIDQVKRQLRKGKAIITYDEKTMSCNIKPAEKPLQAKSD
jgi:uncharacterized protein